MKPLGRNTFKFLIALLAFTISGGCLDSDTPDSSIDKLLTEKTDSSQSSEFKAASVIRVLAIGNSFSEDGLQYVYHLAKAANKTIVIGNLYYGGCSLWLHWSFIKNKSAVYDYQKSVNGTFSHTPNAELLKGLQDENWDLITFQQNSANSGFIVTYSPYLDSIINYVKANATNPKVELAMHQTWAYPNYSTELAFKNYNSNQIQMYQQIASAVDSAARKRNIHIIIPSGTAIQNARSYFGDKLNRDNLHLSVPLGRYIASCVWFETISGINVIGNPYRPDGISYINARRAQEAAHYAVITRNEITDMSGKP